MYKLITQILSSVTFCYFFFASFTRHSCEMKHFLQRTLIDALCLQQSSSFLNVQQQRHRCRVPASDKKKRQSLESFCRSYHFEKITVTSLCIAAAGPGLLWSGLIWILQGEKEHTVFDLQGKTCCADGLKWRSWRLLDRMGADEAELSHAVWTRPIWSPWCLRWWGWARIRAEAQVDLLQIDFRQLETLLDVWTLWLTGHVLTLRDSSAWKTVQCVRVSVIEWLSIIVMQEFFINKDVEVNVYFKHTQKSKVSRHTLMYYCEVYVGTGNA